MRRTSESDPARAVARVLAWTLLQALVYLTVFYAGTAAWAAYNGGWRNDVPRGIMWFFAFWFFLGSALVANACLLSEEIGPGLPRRLAVWGVALVPVVWVTWGSWTWDPTPLSAVLVVVCAGVAVAVREGAHRSRSSASG